MPDSHFRVMSVLISGRELLLHYSNRLLNFGIREGDCVIDYGCGPGAYIPKASQLVGNKGFDYAVDIHPMAITNVVEIIRKKGLTNVRTILAHGYECPLDDDVADVIFMLDAFHMIQDPQKLLVEIHRLLKPSGSFFLDDGHQSRQETKLKISLSGTWLLNKETKDHIQYVPV